MNGVTYKIKERTEDDFTTVIEKHGDVVEFTPVDMVNEQRQLEKLIKELKGKLDIEAQKQENIEQHHPFVKEFTTKELFTLHMYYESVSFAEALPEKIKQFEQQLEESKTEFKHISEALGLAIMPEPKEIVIDKAVAKIVGEEEKPKE